MQTGVDTVPGLPFVQDMLANAPAIVVGGILLALAVLIFRWKTENSTKMSR